MERKWKVLLYDYVRNYNQLEVDYSLDALVSIIEDSDYILRQQQRLRRLAQWHQLRQITPLRCETGLAVTNYREHESGIEADITLRRRFVYEQHFIKFAEEKTEQQHVTFTEKGGKWRIIKIEHPTPERTDLSYLDHMADSSNITDGIDDPIQSGWRQRQQFPIPFLNRQLLTGAESVMPRSVTYNRQNVQRYADKWWNESNPAYLNFSVDCTNYVSQCLFAGGAPMHYTGRRENGWWYQGKSNANEHWSFSWAVSHSLQLFLGNSRTGLRAETVESPQQLAIGDVIAYDWDGKGRFQHSTIVTALDAMGMPLVNAHTVNSRHRFWDYRDSYAWTENTKYRMLHIVDHFNK